MYGSRNLKRLRPKTIFLIFKFTKTSFKQKTKLFRENHEPACIRKAICAYKVLGTIFLWCTFLFAVNVIWNINVSIANLHVGAWKGWPGDSKFSTLGRLDPMLQPLEICSMSVCVYFFLAVRPVPMFYICRSN